MNESDFPLPPPTIEFLVFSLKMQAEIRLGIIAMPGEGPAAPDLRAARHAIDMLAMIEEKTRGNLSLEEQRLIENSLTELRFRFVAITEEVAKTAAANAAAEVKSDDNKDDNKKEQNEPKTDASSTE